MKAYKKCQKFSIYSTSISLNKSILRTPSYLPHMKFFYSYKCDSSCFCFLTVYSSSMGRNHLVNRREMQTSFNFLYSGNCIHYALQEHFALKELTLQLLFSAVLHKHCTLFLLSMLHLSCLHSLGLSITCQSRPHQHSAHHQAVSTAADETLLRAVNQSCFSYLFGKYFVSEKQRTWATMDQSLIFTLLQGQKPLNRK